MVTENLIAHPMWSSQPDAVFHADPHAGNLLLTQDQKLAILDWSLVARLTKSDRILLTQIVLGAITHDGCLIERAIAKLATRDVDPGRLQKVIHDALRQIRCGELPGMAWLTRLMDQAVTESQVRFGTDLLMFRKVLLILQGLLADLQEDCSADALLAVSFLTRLSREWGDRLLTPPFSRAFGTHLSNADLMLVGMSGSLSVASYWCGAYRDLWQLRNLSPRSAPTL
jgi:ubiquinone biosynthesis protein